MVIFLSLLLFFFLQSCSSPIAAHTWKIDFFVCLSRFLCVWSHTGLNYAFQKMRIKRFHFSFYAPLFVCFSAVFLLNLDSFEKRLICVEIVRGLFVFFASWSMIQCSEYLIIRRIKFKNWFFHFKRDVFVKKTPFKNNPFRRTRVRLPVLNELSLCLRAAVGSYTFAGGQTHSDVQPWVAWQLRDIGWDLKGLSLL